MKFFIRTILLSLILASAFFLFSCNDDTPDNETDICDESIADSENADTETETDTDTDTETETDTETDTETEGGPTKPNFGGIGEF